MRKQISLIMALLVAVGSFSGCSTVSSTASLLPVSGGNEVGEAVLGEVSTVGLKEFSIGSGLFLPEGEEIDDKALIIEESAPVFTTIPTVTTTIEGDEEPTVTSLGEETQITVVTNNEGETVTDSKGSAVTSIVSVDSGYNLSGSVVTSSPATTTITTTTEVPETTTTVTTATTKETTTTTTTSSSPSVESEFGVDYEIAERAKNLVVNCGDGYDNTAEADDLFLEVLNSYRVNHGLEGCKKGSATYEWQTYFSDRFLRHLDRCNVIMHSVLGSRGVASTTEIITVQKNSMTVWEAFKNFMESPDHRSAIDDTFFNNVVVLITFFEGSPEQGSQYNYTNNNNVFCLVNFNGGTPNGESWYGFNIEDFEAFLSCEINLSAFSCNTGDASIAEEKVGNTNRCTYKFDEMRCANEIINYSLQGYRWDSWWSEEVERCANVIFTGFSDALENGRYDNAIYGADTDDALLQYLAYLQDPWSCLED